MDMKIQRADDLSSFQIFRLWVHDLAQVIQQEANKCDISEFKRFGCFGTIAKQSDVASIERT